jgi:hypothetical protein
MVDPGQVESILNDAARLVQAGEIVVFGSAALALWLAHGPTTRDVDLWCNPAEKGDVLVALMGELSWYHTTHGAYVEVWAPETFTAPHGWRERARVRHHQDFPDVRLIIPHPHDVLVSKLERFETKDREHFAHIVEEYPLSPEAFDLLVAGAPHERGEVDDLERVGRFRTGAAVVRRLLEGRTQ